MDVLKTWSGSGEDMNVGFNQNVNFNGEVYHAQTEDGGPANPVITTVLFKGGVIIASRRTNYSDIIRSDKRDLVVRQVMKEQHDGLIDDLKAGRIIAPPFVAPDQLR